MPSLVFFAICLQSFYNFQHPSFHNPQKSDIGFHDQRVYFIIIHKNPALCVGRVHTSSYCKTVTLTSTGVVSFFNKNDMKALQFTCRKYISCKFVTVKMPDKIWFANFCYWDKLFIYSTWLISPIALILSVISYRTKLQIELSHLRFFFNRKINSIKYSSSCLKTARCITRTQYNRCTNTYKFIWLNWYQEYAVKSWILCRDSVLNHVNRHIYCTRSCLLSDIYKF